MTATITDGRSTEAVDYSRRRDRVGMILLALANIEKTIEFLVGGWLLSIFIVVDGALAWNLFRGRPWARRLGVLRAALTWPFWFALTDAQSGVGTAAVVGITEGVISISLVLVLWGKASRTRTWLGAAVFSLYPVLYLLMALTVVATGR